MNQRKFIKPIKLIMPVLNINIKATFKIWIEVHNMKSLLIYLRKNNYKYLILNMKRVIFGWKVVRNSLKCQKLSEKVTESISCSVVPDSLQSHGLTGSSVYGILQARILEWVAIPFSRGSSWPRDPTCIGLLHWWKDKQQISVFGWFIKLGLEKS